MDLPNKSIFLGVKSFVILSLSKVSLYSISIHLPMFKRSLVFLLSACVIVFLISGCKNSKNKKNRITQANSIYSSEQYSDSPIDSQYVKEAVDKDSTLRPYAEDILAFYQRRGYESAWLDHDTLTISAHDLMHTLAAYESEFRDSSVDAALDNTDIGAMLLSGMTRGRAMLDLRLTGTFFKYAHHAYGGTAADLKDLEWYIPRMKKDYQRLIDSLVKSPATYSIYEPVNGYYKALKKALVQYRAIEMRGGLPLIQVARLPLHIGDSSEAVTVIKATLSTTTDYTDPDRSARYTDSLRTAVARYQQRVGLKETGTIDSLTLAEINTPIATRIRQIMLNMERLRWMPDTLPAAYLLVNIPEYRLHVYEDAQEAWTMDVVVGNAATATSVFMSRLSVVDICPYWNVPQSIIRNELLPILKRNPSYLNQANMEVVQNGTVINSSSIYWNKYTKGVPFVIRQKPGPQNSLGLVAFFFPNSFDIYLHDTPAKSFFKETSRAFSHGCIRLAEPKKLADYIFRRDSTMTPEHIGQLMEAHREQKFAVKPSIPVYIGYFTAWVDSQGRVNFRHDVYGLDTKLAKEIFGR